MNPRLTPIPAAKDRFNEIKPQVKSIEEIKQIAKGAEITKAELDKTHEMLKQSIAARRAIDLVTIKELLLFHQVLYEEVIECLYMVEKTQKEKDASDYWAKRG